MPLSPGSSMSVIRANYLKLIKEGYPESRAWAIAYEEAKKKRKSVRKKGK